MAYRYQGNSNLGVRLPFTFAWAVADNVVELPGALRPCPTSSTPALAKYLPIYMIFEDLPLLRDRRSHVIFLAASLLSRWLEAFSLTLV